jgi:hypothetical protein
MRAYVLAVGLVFVAAAAWAALPSPDNPAPERASIRIDVQQASHDVMNHPWDPWERVDRFNEPLPVEHHVHVGSVPRSLPTERLVWQSNAPRPVTFIYEVPVPPRGLPAASSRPHHLEGVSLREVLKQSNVVWP